MKVYRLPGKPGVKSTVSLTLIGQHESVDPTRVSVNSRTAIQAGTEPFASRLRRNLRKPSTFVGPMPLAETGTTYKELCAKYAADIARGRELQTRIFGGK
jgi:hypothetical protein